MRKINQKGTLASLLATKATARSEVTDFFHQRKQETKTKDVMNKTQNSMQR